MRAKPKRKAECRRARNQRKEPRSVVVVVVLDGESDSVTAER
jgi:hypothetical protein